MEYLLKPFQEGSVHSFMLRSEHSKKSNIKHKRNLSSFQKNGDTKEKEAELNEMINRQKINTRNTSDYA